MEREGDKGKEAGGGEKRGRKRWKGNGKKAGRRKEERW